MGETTRGPAKARRRSAAETTEVVLAAALATVAADGVDGATLPRVAERAGTSIGPLYSRFDSTDDLLSTLWAAELRPHLDRLFAEAAAWIVDGDPAAVTRWRAELHRPSARAQALLEAMAVTRRYPYSHDAITADATAAFERFLAAVHPVPRATAGYALASLFGSLFLHPVLAPAARSAPDDLLGITRALCAAGTAPTGPGVTDLTVTIPMPEVAGGDAVSDAFLNAALAVIARGGFEHASASRIARTAGLSASRAYEHFTSKHDLASRAVASIVDQVVGVNALAFVGVDRATYRRLVLATGTALCDPASLPVRRLRLECLLAARHHTDIRATTRRSFDRAEQSVTTTFAAHAPTGSPEALAQVRQLWHLVRNFGFGVLALHEAAGLLTPDFDLAPLADALPALYQTYIADPVGITI